MPLTVTQDLHTMPLPSRGFAHYDSLDGGRTAWTVRTRGERDADDTRSHQASRKCPGYPRGGHLPGLAGQGTKLAPTFSASTTPKHQSSEQTSETRGSYFLSQTSCRWPRKESGFWGALFLYAMPLFVGCQDRQLDTLNKGR